MCYGCFGYNIDEGIAEDSYDILYYNKYMQLIFTTSIYEEE